MIEKIKEILEDIVSDFDENETALIDNGILSSLNVLQLVVELGDEFDISIPPAYIKPDNFNSVEAIARLVEKIQEEE